MAAVADVILNRVHSTGFPKTIYKVVHQGCQFTFVCQRQGGPKEEDAWNAAVSMAIEKIQQGKPNNSYLFFHTVGISPSWAKKLTLEKRIGNHKFYSCKDC